MQYNILSICKSEKAYKEGQQMKREINYELINDLYMRWFNERDPFIQRKIKDDIIKRISPYELLIYSERFLSPY